MKLVMLQGLPASGKSTYARDLASKGWVRVNKDDLRAMLHDSKWNKKNEAQVIRARDFLVNDALSNGQSVVVDDTNFAEFHKETLKAIAKKHNACFSVDKRFLQVDVQTCIERDVKRANGVGKDAIMKMYNQYLKPPVSTYVPPEGKPTAIIVDIDGTLAHGVGVHRGPFEWAKVCDDTVDQTIVDLVKREYSSHDYTILMSGRDSCCRAATETWLKSHGINYELLYMRAEGDYRKDSVVKLELFEKYVRDNFNVKYVLDDRQQMVDAWRSIGLKVLQVAEGDF